MDDRLHQPYRERALFPWLSSVFAEARAAGALGVALSGAGPSVLAVARDGEAASVAEAMRQALERTGRAGDGVVLAADPLGARVERFCD
jgi:homoserine kinase